MITRAIFILSLMALIYGCASDPLAEQKHATKLMEYKMQVHGPACEKLGFEKDTDRWRECIQKEYEQTMIRQQYRQSYPYWNPYYERPFYYYRR